MEDPLVRTGNSLYNYIVRRFSGLEGKSRIKRGLDDLHPPIANREVLVDGTPGVDIYPELAPAPGEHVIKKHRYSGFFGTDLDIILREWEVDTVIISGTTTENCCHGTGRDVLQLPGRLSVGRDSNL